MMKILFLILVLMGSFFRASAQNYIPYYVLVNEAEYEIYKKNFIRAADKFNAAFKLEKPHARDAYLLAYCLSEINSEANESKIRKLLINASKTSNSIPEFLKNQPLKIDPDSVFIAKLESHSEKWTKKTMALRDTVEYFSTMDKGLIKFFLDSISPEKNETKITYPDLSSYLTQRDSIKQVEFLDYIKLNGYPGIYSSGTDVSASILTRIREPLYMEYEKVLFEELKKGHIQPYFYGLMVDKLGCIRNNKSYYGTTDPDHHCQPPGDEIILNRLTIGMSPYFQGPRRSVEISNESRLDFD